VGQANFLFSVFFGRTGRGSSPTDMEGSVEWGESELSLTVGLLARNLVRPRSAAPTNTSQRFISAIVFPHLPQKFFERCSLPQLSADQLVKV
jgi:hypothetical protein